MWDRQMRRADLAQVYWSLAAARPGWRVADVGCGPGYFTLRYAALTGPTGHVHAVDADEEALAFLHRKLDPVHDAHVTLENLDVTKAPLPDLNFDVVFFCDVLHHVEQPLVALRHVREAGAKLVLAEFDPAGPGEVGPPLAQRLAPHDVEVMLREAGWLPGRTERLAHEHYAVVARP